MTKFCVDCKHCYWLGGDIYHCEAPKVTGSVTLDLVSGKQLYSVNCSTQRLGISLPESNQYSKARCGTSAIFWEPRS